MTMTFTCRTTTFVWLSVSAYFYFSFLLNKIVHLHTPAYFKDSILHSINIIYQSFNYTLLMYNEN